MYVPLTITSTVMFLIVIAIRIYSNRKIGNASASNKRQRKYSLTSSQMLRGTMVSIEGFPIEENASINYKVNLVRTMAVFMSYF